MCFDRTYSCNTWRKHIGMEPIKLRVLLAASCGSELSKKFDYYYQNELTVPAPCDDETGKASTS